MDVVEDVYELFTETDRTSYSPTSFNQKLEAACEPLGVTFHSDSKLPRNGFGIRPGHSRKETALLAECKQGPEKPRYSHRPSRAGFSVDLELTEEAGYDAVVRVGPHAVAYVTPTDAHKYLTTEVDGDISGASHLSYLTVEACEELIFGFFCSEGFAETNQESLDEY